MARNSSVEYADVASACVQLFHAGESVSFAKVYALIGSRGGQQVVSDMIRRWKTEVADRLLARREHPELPEVLVSHLDEMAATVWRLALERSDETLTVARGELELERSEIRVRVQAADERAAGLEVQVHELQVELASTKSKLEARDLAICELDIRLRELDAVRVEKEAQIGGLREDLARALASLEAERVRHDDALLAMQRIHEGAVQKKTEAHVAEIAALQERADANHRHFMLQTDEIRQAHKAKADSLLEQLEGQRMAADGYRRQAYQARDDASKWQGKFELVAEELAEAKKIIGKVQRHKVRSEQQ